MMQPLMNIVGNIAYVAVCVLGSMLVDERHDQSSA